MDYVPAHGNTAMLDDREDTSGARVFDGEDQGKSRIKTVTLPESISCGAKRITP